MSLSMVRIEIDNHNVIDSLAVQFNLEWCCDAVIRCGSAEAPILCHKALLAEKSLLLSHCFSNVPPCQLATVILPDFDRETVNLFITFLNTGLVQCNGAQRPLLFELFTALCPEQCGQISVNEDIATCLIDSTVENVVPHIKTEFTNDFPDNLLEFETFEDARTACLHNDNIWGYLIDNVPSARIDTNSDLTSANDVLDTNLSATLLAEGNENCATSHSPNSGNLHFTSFNKECSVILTDVMKCLDSHELNSLTIIRNNVEHSNDDILMKSPAKKKVQCFGGLNKSDMMNCPRCGQNVSRASYKTHFDLHSDTKPYVCLVCKKRVNHLKLHMRVHTEEKPFACEVCGKAFAQKYNVKLHMQVHTRDKPLQCTYCDVRFSSKKTLLSHTARRHTNEYQFRCPYCKKGTTTKRELQSHIRNKHSKKSRHCCLTCKTGFDSTKAFQKHVAQCRASTPTETETIVSQQAQRASNEYVEHSKNYDDNYLMKLPVKKKVQCSGRLNNCDMMNCAKCGQSVSLAKYREHFDQHTSTKPYVCLVCKMRVHNLKVHMRVHTGEKPFHCGVCWRTFTTKFNVKLHMQVHNRDKPLQCTYCDLRFSSKKTLLSHTARQHTYEYQFRCPYCNKGTTTKAGLQSHIGNKHSKKSRHRCLTCKTGFDSTKAFQKHVAQCRTSSPAETETVIS